MNGVDIDNAFCSLCKQLQRMTWDLKSVLATIVKSRILLEGTLVEELKETFLPGREVSTTGLLALFSYCFLRDQTNRPSY